jgi:hypothetical protein
MTQDEIIEMARQAGSLIELAQEKDLVWLASFANLVAQHEREACAKVCEEYVGYGTRDKFAATIRARGQA